MYSLQYLRMRIEVEKSSTYEHCSGNGKKDLDYGVGALACYFSCLGIDCVAVGFVVPLE